ncbi:MAG: hypothetical protein J6A29_05985 [Clostridia bacterium]|nr:hypothetical protein [Clostridia bacterium]
MNILFVTLKALETNTSVTKSNIGLIKGFRDMGLEVDIIMPYIDKSLFYYDSSFDISSFNVYRINSQTIGDKIAVASSKSIGIRQKIISIIRNLYYKFKVLDRGTQLLNEVKNINVYNKYYDYVISTSDPKSSHLFVKKMIKEGLKYGKWIQHWGDPLASDITYSGLYPMFWRKLVEKKIISSADEIVYVSPFTFTYQKDVYKKLQNKMRFVPLTCDLNTDFLKEQISTTLLKKDKLRIAYLGDYNSRIRNIFPLYNVCKNNKKYNLTIAGNTDLSLMNTENIKIFPRITSDKIKKIERDSDVIVSIGNLHGNQIPGKIYYAASSKKVILVATDGEYKEQMKEYLNSYNRFECCDNTEESLEITLNRIYNNLVEKNIENMYSTPESLLPINVAKKIIE